jgi:CTP synthase (UTP-ammonia lyase)
MTQSIALIGNYNEHVVAHKAIPLAIELVNKLLGADFSWAWIETETIQKENIKNLNIYSGIWAVPGSPYKNMEGAISAIQFAREHNKPFLGTCGGFQHALIEYARNVCGAQKATHSETNPNDQDLVITPLTCSLVGETGKIFYIPGSFLNSICEDQTITEEYHCNYGLNAKWKQTLESAGLIFSGYDHNKEVRAFELPSHPFFVGTLFQPERTALKNMIHPIIYTFLKKALDPHVT